MASRALVAVAPAFPLFNFNTGTPPPAFTVTCNYIVVNDSDIAVDNGVNRQVTVSFDYDTIKHANDAITDAVQANEADPGLEVYVIGQP